VTAQGYGSASNAMIRVTYEFYCPNCHLEDVMDKPLPPGGTRFHVCPALHGINAPLLPRGVPAMVVAREREDYVGKEVGVLMDDRGKAIMSVETIRDNGTDVAVFAPTAQARAEE